MVTSASKLGKELLGKKKPKQTEQTEQTKPS
jgi:hypothetical protein